MAHLSLVLANYKKVIENYFFMTVLQFLSSFFYLLIYPFLIRTLGTESYGLYVFALAITTYFITFISFGFDFPAVKAIAKNQDDIGVKSRVLSCVSIAKIYLLIISIVIFVIILALTPRLNENWGIYSICFVQVINNILFPIWYFQGMQKMKIVTFIQLLFKLFSLPFIFLMITGPSDIGVFTLIMTLSTVFGGIAAFFILLKYEKLKFNWYPYRAIYEYYKDSLPFFCSSFTGIARIQGANLLIGTFWGMSDVAIYDLASKILLLPQNIMANINGALFPKIINNLTSVLVKKIIYLELFLGLLAVVFIICFGKWLVSLLGGELMQDSYMICVISSFSLPLGLVVGAYTNFVFVPLNRYYYITLNQVVAFVSFFATCVIGYLLSNNIMVVAIAITLSSLSELLYCSFLIKQKKWLYNDFL